MIDILVELDYLEPEEQIEAPLAPIKIDKPTKVETTAELIVHPDVKKKPVVTKKPVIKEPVNVKKQSVQELFQTKEPKPKPVQKVIKPTVKPSYNSPMHDNDEDMF